MGKTYRDMVRGRYRANTKKFESDVNNKEWLEYSFYRNKRDKDGILLKDEHGQYIFEKCTDLRFDTKIELKQKRPWDLLSYQEQKYVAPWSTPSWWNNLFNNRWKRSQDKQLCKQMIIDYDGELDYRFYYGNKPHVYYW